MSDEKNEEMSVLPLLMQVGEQHMLIGKIVMLPRKAPGQFQLLGSIDAFPGERLTFSRIVIWDEFLEFVKARRSEENLDG